MLEAKKVSQEQQAALLEDLSSDYRRAALLPADRAMLAYVVKLTERPAEIEASDIETLRAEGFEDRGIHDICSITSYYAFVNRIADGLGVELEGES